MTDLLLNDHYLQSFVDSNLSDEESTRVWRAILASPVFRRKHELLIEQKKMLMKWWNSLTLLEQGDVFANMSVTRL